MKRQLKTMAVTLGLVVMRGRERRAGADHRPVSRAIFPSASMSGID